MSEKIKGNSVSIIIALCTLFIAWGGYQFTVKKDMERIIKSAIAPLVVQIKYNEKDGDLFKADVKKKFEETNRNISKNKERLTVVETQVEELVKFKDKHSLKDIDLNTFFSHTGVKND